jgi:hypothetical protein
MRVREFDAAETYRESDAAAEYLLSSASDKKIGLKCGDLRIQVFARVPSL